MKKFLISFLFVFLMILSINVKTVFAAAGDRTTPYSAWNDHIFTYQEYSWDTPRTVEMQLIGMYAGTQANLVIANENALNKKPAADEQWILLDFGLRYVSGPQAPLYASDVIGSLKSFYTSSGQKITPISTAIFSNMLAGYGEHDVQLYPGAAGEVVYGILVKKTVGVPMIRIGSGYNSSTHETIYKWFSTDKSYYENAAPLYTKAASNSYNSNKLNWMPVNGASGYEIYRATSSNGTYTKAAAVSGFSYIDTSLNTGTTYYYKIRSYKTGTQTMYSGFSNVISSKPIPAAPSSVKASSSSYNSITTSWAPVSGASGYEVYRATSSTGAYSLVGTTTGTSFYNGSLTTNVPYYYKVRAYRIVGNTKVYSSYSTIVNAKPIPATPTSVKATSSSYNSITTSWAPVSGASGYEVYRATSSTGAYSLVGSTTGTSFYNGALTTNVPYYYKVRAYRIVGNTKVYSSYSTIVNAKPIPATPTNFKASRLSSTSIKLTWSSVAGASGYEVYRSTSISGTYNLLGSSTFVEYTNNGLTAGNTYYYKLRAYRTVGTTRIYSGWTTVVSAKP